MYVYGCTGLHSVNVLTHTTNMGWVRAGCEGVQVDINKGSRRSTVHLRTVQVWIGNNSVYESVIKPEIPHTTSCSKRVT